MFGEMIDAMLGLLAVLCQISVQCFPGHVGRVFECLVLLICTMDRNSGAVNLC